MSETASPRPNVALAEAIDDSGYRKSFVAAQVGIAPATLSRYLSGHQVPELVVREKLALLLRRRPDDFLIAHDAPVDQASTGSDPADRSAA